MLMLTAGYLHTPAGGRAPLTQSQAYALADALGEADGLLAAMAFEDSATGNWRFEATCEAPPDLESLSEVARATLGSGVDFAVSEMDAEVDWVGRSLEGLKPVVAGGFYVYGSHESNRVPAGLTPLMIDAAQAFGTGHHETTTGCLQAIDLVLKQRRVIAPLDVGTGTGVLAIGIAKRRRVAVVASDIDPVAVRTTADNARLNGVGSLIRPVCAAGLDHARIRDNAPYDLIVANILAGPLTGLAPALSQAASSGAAIILSGILVPQARRVIAAYRAQNTMLRRRIVNGDWATLILEKR